MKKQMVTGRERNYLSVLHKTEVKQCPIVKSYHCFKECKSNYIQDQICIQYSTALGFDAVM